MSFNHSTIPSTVFDNNNNFYFILITITYIIIVLYMLFLSLGHNGDRGKVKKAEDQDASSRAACPCVPLRLGMVLRACVCLPVYPPSREDSGQNTGAPSAQLTYTTAAGRPHRETTCVCLCVLGTVLRKSGGRNRTLCLQSDSPKTAKRQRPTQRHDKQAGKQAG